MHVRKVKLQNFMSYRTAEFAVEDLGLVLVEGLNHDQHVDPGSNGAGKSALVADALSWCLFGRTLRGTSHDQVVRAGAAKGCFVRMTAKAFGREVEVTRYRSHPKYKNSVHIVVDGLDVSPSVDPTGAIQRLLRVTPEVWQYAIVLGQGLSFRFSRLTDAERVSLLEEICGLKVYDEARSRSYAKRSELRLASESMERERGTLLARRGSDEARCTETSRLVAEWEAAASAEFDPKQLLVVEQEFAETVQSLTELESRLDTARAQAQEHKGALAAARWDVDKSHRAAYTAQQAAAEAEQSAAVVAAGQCDRCGQGLRTSDRQEIHARLRARMADHQRDADLALAHKTAAQQSADDLTAKLGLADALFRQTQEEVTLLRKRRDAVKDRLASAQRAALATKTLNGCRSLYTRATADLRNTDSAITGLSERLEQTGQELAVLDFWIDGFARLRRQSLHGAANYLSTRFAHYASSLFGRDVEASVGLVEKEAASGTATKVLIGADLPGGSLESASGGERDRVDIALALALHDLVTKSSGFRTNFLVADEIGNFVDTSGLERLVGLLRDKAEQIGTVFVMAQSPVWAGMIEDRWLVEKRDAVSTLSYRKRTALVATEHGGNENVASS